MVEIDPNNEEQADEIVRRLTLPRQIFIPPAKWQWSNVTVDMTMNASLEKEIIDIMCQDMSNYIDKEMMRIINGESY